MPAGTYSLFCMGNPLLDIQVKGNQKLLDKYHLNANDAILADPEQHADLYDELVENYEVTYVAGGAAQNTARAAAYILPPGSVVYTGSVGEDDRAKQLKIANNREGLDEVYQVTTGAQTGACAVVITGHFRSLVTTLGAAEKFQQSHLSSPEVSHFVQTATFFYVEGYFLTHGVESAIQLSQHAAGHGKTFILNLSAPFIPLAFNENLQKVMPYCDIIIGNESEAEAWASANGVSPSNDPIVVAKKIANLPKTNSSRPRIVLITQGTKPTILARSDVPDKTQEFNVKPLGDEEIIDTNGAGDAFAGGFIGALISGKTPEESVQHGHTLAQICVGQLGPQFKWPKVPILDN